MLDGSAGARDSFLDPDAGWFEKGDRPMTFGLFAIILIKILMVVGVSMGTVSYLILIERKIAAWAQDRLGPNRVGPYGLVQPLIDGAKMILKEDVTPDYVAKPIYTLAPMLAIIAAMIGFAVVPFGPVGATPRRSSATGSTSRSPRASISGSCTSWRSAASGFTA